MIRYFAFFPAFFCVISLVSCGNSDAGVPTPEEVYESAQERSKFGKPSAPQHKLADYVKPGASVTFSHNYDGQTDPRTRDSFVLNVKPAYKSGSLDLRLFTSSGLDLLVESEQSFEMFGDVIAVPVEIYADEAGSYRLNISVGVGMTEMMPSMRSHTITINVGAPAEVSRKGSDLLIGNPDGESVISTPAVETIY